MNHPSIIVFVRSLKSMQQWSTSWREVSQVLLSDLAVVKNLELNGVITMEWLSLTSREATNDRLWKVRNLCVIRLLEKFMVSRGFTNYFSNKKNFSGWTVSGWIYSKKVDWSHAESVDLLSMYIIGNKGHGHRVFLFFSVTLICASLKNTMWLWGLSINQ